MRAAVCTAYGPPEVLQMRTVPDPRPRDKEVCIRLVATAVTASDCIVRGLKLRGVYRLFMRAAFGFRAPRKGIIGMIAAGEIESVGREVTSFKPGDQVFGMNGFRAGAYAEKVCWPASSALALRPANLTYEESAALPYGGANRVVLRASAEGWEEPAAAGLWSFGGDRHVRGAACQASRRRGDRRLQHHEPRACAVAGCDHGDRLHKGGLHTERPALRRHLRRRWQTEEREGDAQRRRGTRIGRSVEVRR